jgi:hypothetical protein
MSAKECKKAIVAEMGKVLSPAGYRNRGSQFTRDAGDVVHLVSLQASTASTSTALKATVNVAIWIPALEEDAKPNVWSAHWRNRLGHLTPEHSDIWWHASSAEEAKSSGAKIANAIREFALPLLETFATRRALLALWETGVSPGLTSVEADRFRRRLLSLVEAG